MDNALKAKVDTCYRTAEDFARLYYNSVDTRRHLMGRFYSENAVFSWNGNGVTGRENIAHSFLELNTSTHQILNVDAQPLSDDIVGAQTTYMILVSGTVKFHGKSTKNFQQTFMITAENNIWKIVSDCYRLQQAIYE